MFSISGAFCPKRFLLLGCSPDKEEMMEETEIMTETIEETVESSAPETEEQTGESSVPETEEQAVESTVQETEEQAAESTVQETEEQAAESTVQETEEQTAESTVQETEEQAAESSSSEVEDRTESAASETVVISGSSYSETQHEEILAHMEVLHADLTNIYTGIQYLNCLIIVLFLIILCVFVYRFFNMFLSGNSKSF